MRLYELFDGAGIPLPENVENIEISNITTDSREVCKGSMFICLCGARDDGHRYIDDAVKAGASVIVAEQVRDACVGGAAAYIMLDNTRRVAALLYNSWYGGPASKLKIIGVTGTNGKTSVTTMLYEIFSAAGARCGLIGTVRCLSADRRVLSPINLLSSVNMTTPAPKELYGILSEMVNDRVEYVFLEVSSHALALERTAAISFDGAVFTNLTQDHLDFHGSMEEYYEAKKKLFADCKKGFINIDGEYGKRLCNECGGRVFTVSANAGDFYARNVKSYGLGGSGYTLVTPMESIEIAIPLLGNFQIENSMMAAAVALGYGISSETVVNTLATTKGVAGRMEKISVSGCDTTVIIDYAHTPDALERLLLSVKAIRRGNEHITLVFGCGGERDREKRREMARIASKLADLVIVTSDNCRGEPAEQIFSDILKGIDKERPYALIKDRATAIESAIISARSEEIVILAGKGHEKYEIDANGAHPFDEKRIARSALKKRRSNL